MLFNSFAFAVFLPTVFLAYWAVAKQRLAIQNTLLLISSYVFYGWWDWRFLTLIFISSAVDYVVARQIDVSSTTGRRKGLLALSIIVNLGFLCFFKYFGFFVDSFAELLRQVGLNPSVRTLHIILPVGISFYTFQTLGYTIDVYKRKISATKDPIAFFAYVSFFTQLVAGPIERAKNLLPQFEKARVFEMVKAKDGLRQILWGLFKKVVIADNLARYVDDIYTNYAGLDGIVLGLGTFFFAIQIYCDFSGYSDIAIGAARLFGFNLMRNFAFPYFSRDIAEFWRRWHISLSTWFRDFVYIPLGGSDKSRGRHIRNVLVTFTVSGFWHGANWTFLGWGLLHGLYYLPLMFVGKQRRHTDTVADGRWLPGFVELGQMLMTFALVLLAWCFFRADSIQHAFAFVGHMTTHNWLVAPRLFVLPTALCIGLLVIEWMQRAKQHALQIEFLPGWARWSVYYAVLAVIFMYGNMGHVPFIYFQF